MRLIFKQMTFDISQDHKKALTLLCRSRNAVLLGGGFSFIRLLWHLCDRGLLGNVVLHCFLQFGLEKVPRTMLPWLRLEWTCSGRKGWQYNGYQMFHGYQSRHLDSSCLHRRNGGRFFLNRLLLCRCRWCLFLRSISLHAIKHEVSINPQKSTQIHSVCSDITWPAAASSEAFFFFFFFFFFAAASGTASPLSSSSSSLQKKKKKNQTNKAWFHKLSSICLLCR